TYFTSGAYVTISRSRRAGLCLARYSRHSACMSSGRLTAREYGVRPSFPLVTERRERHRNEPDPEREGGDGDDPPARAVAGGGDRDEEKAGREGDEEESERPPLH